jgi:hypothetical protein
MTATQSSPLLGALFAQCESDERLTVLHMGSAMPETVAFFSRYRSKLFFVDIYSELPVHWDEARGVSLERQFEEILGLPADTQLDICLFWDVFDYLDDDSVAALLSVLRPHLHRKTLAHGFGVYNLKSVQSGHYYGIETQDTLKVRARARLLPGYAPHPQSKLKKLLDCFNFDRSVLLSDSRLEVLLSSKTE